MMSSMCAVHLNAPSVVTCRRCGRFCCTNCLPQFETCPECVARTTVAVPPVTERATLAIGGLWVAAGSHVVMAAVAIAQVVYAEDSAVLSIVSGLVSISNFFVVVLTILFVCVWFHRATMNALARGAQLEVDSPAAAVVSWFIPILNLARPFNITRGMLVSAGRDPAPVAAWQGMWIVGNITSYASGQFFSGPEGFGLNILSDALLVGAALTLIQIVRSLKWPEASDLQRS